MKTVIEMARAVYGANTEWSPAQLERLEQFACIAVREAVLAERDACAKVCENLLAPERMCLDNEAFWKLVTLDCADAIRARSEA